MNMDGQDEAVLMLVKFDRCLTGVWMTVVPYSGTIQSVLLQIFLKKYKY